MGGSSGIEKERKKSLAASASDNKSLTNASRKKKVASRYPAQCC